LAAGPEASLEELAGGDMTFCGASSSARSTLRPHTNTKLRSPSASLHKTENRFIGLSIS
jgi:hypothetical protein